MLHDAMIRAAASRLEDLQREARTARLKRTGYLDIREPRRTRHWANR